MPSYAPRLSAGPRIIVVGAGAIGLFCAVRLASRGAAVTVVEADAAAARLSVAPRSSSYAAAGMLGPYSEVLYEGPAHHRRLTDLGHQALTVWQQILSSAPRLRDLVRQNGTLLLAHDDAEEARLQRVAVRAQNMGVRVGIHRDLPDDLDLGTYGARVRLALRLPQEALIDAAEALAALELALVQDGGSLLRERSVHSVVTTAGRVSGVDLNDGGHLAADLVVLAPGALGGPGLAEVCPALRRLTPAKGQLGVVHPRTDEVFGETLRTPSAYVVPGRLGELVFGATMEFGRLDFEEDQPALDSLFAHVRRILPGVRFDGPPAPYAVAVRPMSADWGPLVGPSGPEGLMVAAGHGRNGWLLAPATAQAISAYVFDDPVTPLWESFHPARFEAKAA